MGSLRKVVPQNENNLASAFVPFVFACFSDMKRSSGLLIPMLVQATEDILPGGGPVELCRSQHVEPCE